MFSRLQSSILVFLSFFSPIASASHEQSSGLNQINSAVSLLSESTQINTSTSKQSAMSSHILSEQVEKMNVEVSELALVIEGRAA